MSAFGEMQMDSRLGRERAISRRADPDPSTGHVAAGPPSREIGRQSLSEFPSLHQILSRSSRGLAWGRKRCVHDEIGPHVPCP